MRKIIFSLFISLLSSVAFSETFYSYSISSGYIDRLIVRQSASDFDSVRYAAAMAFCSGAAHPDSGQTYPYVNCTGNNRNYAGSAPDFHRYDMHYNFCPATRNGPNNDPGTRYYSYATASQCFYTKTPPVVDPPPQTCADGLEETPEGNCVCPAPNTAYDGNQCVDACPVGMKQNGMCFSEECPYGDGPPAACAQNECINGQVSVELIPGFLMCVNPDQGGGSSSSAGSSSGGDGGDDGGSGGGGSSSSGGGSDNPQNCPAGTGWGTIGGISDCWGGYDEYPQYDCPPGLVGGLVNDVYVCHKLHDYSCPAGQTWGSINGTYACHGTTPEPCTGGQTWGSVNGVVGCHGQPVNSCPEGQFFGTVNGLSGCWGSPSCPTGFTHGSVNGVVGCYSNAGCDSLGNCSKPPTGGSSSSASSAGSGGGGNGSSSGGGSSAGNSSAAGAGQCDPTSKNYAVCIGQVAEVSDGFAGEITQTFDTAGRGKIDENITNLIDDIENFNGIEGDFQTAPSALESAVKAFLPSSSSCSPIVLKMGNHTAQVDCGLFVDFRLIFGWFLTACAAVYIWSFSTAPINR